MLCSCLRSLRSVSALPKPLSVPVVVCHISRDRRAGRSRARRSDAAASPNTKPISIVASFAVGAVIARVDAQRDRSTVPRRTVRLTGVAARQPVDGSAGAAVGVDRRARRVSMRRRAGRRRSTIRSPDRSTPSAALPGSTSATTGSLLTRSHARIEVSSAIAPCEAAAQQHRPEQHERDQDVDAGPARITAIRFHGAACSRRGRRRAGRVSRFDRAHAGDLHVAARGDRADRVVGLAAFDPERASGGKNSEKRSTRIPTAFATAKWPSSCSTISAMIPRSVSTQLTRSVWQARRIALPRASPARSAAPLAQRCDRLAARARGPRGRPRTASRRSRTGCAAERVERPLDHLRRSPGSAGRPSRNACTAISLAAFSTHGAVPPARAASRASRRHGNASRSTGSNVEPADRREVERLDRQLDALAAVQRVGDRDPHVRRPEVREHRAVGELHQPVDQRLRVDDDVDPLVRACRTGGGPPSPRGPCSSASPSRS